ncbi:MAG: peptidase U35 [Paracoccus sp. (in: a-proteobacteria)]|uniref:prohead protease/major capsid protein fusion protein n=1 Tax=Paracoccus sp. TaxID=267 RepID=UPI0039E673D3
MENEEILDLPVIGRAGTLQSVDETARTFEVLWTTGAQVRRYSWARDEEFDEELVVSANAMRLDRLNSGAPFLNSHSSWSLSSILGVVEDGSIRIEGGRAFARIRLSERDEVEPIWRDIKAGIIRNVSVGYRVHRFERVAKADRTDGGQRALYRAVDWEPVEISAVAIGADPGAGMRSEAGQLDARRNSCTLVTRAGNAAAAAPPSPKGRTMENENDPAGGDENRAAQTPAQAPAPAQAAPAPADVEAIRAEERTRVSTIMTLCARHGLDAAFQSDLIARGVSVADAREAVLDKLVDNDTSGRTVELAPAQARGNGDIAYRDAMTEALTHRANPGAGQISSGAREFRGLSLMEMARHAVERSGTRTGGMSKMELAGAALGQRAGVGYHGTSDFPSILANVANKTLRDAYASTPRTFAAWARRATITDFRPVQRTQLGGAPDLQKVLESGEFQYGTIGEGKEVYALASYGRIIAFTRQSLINDDLDAFARVPAAFGASAADLESDIVYSILMQNPNMGDGTALFHANHGNLGTASVISEAALAAAYRAFGQQKGTEERLISVLPRFILVPPGSRSVEARKQVTATTPSSTSDVNTFSGRLEVIEEPRLIPAAGQDPWFLAADPARIDTVEYAYLDGQEGVFTETRMGFEVDGIEIKARHDFAAKAIDWRGLWKNPGAAA